MSLRRPYFGSRSTSAGRQQTRSYTTDSNMDSTSKPNVIPNILPELTQIIRRLLPQELPLNMHVRDVEYIENGSKGVYGTLYMTTFRLVFGLDKENDDTDSITFGNKYIGDFDIPLTSIYKIHVAPVDTRSGFKSFLNDNQIQSETHTFTIITKDFRHVTFTKCSVTKSNTNGNKHPSVSVTQMGTYIDALKVHSQFQSRDQLYLYLALNPSSTKNLSLRGHRAQTLPVPSNNGRTIDHAIADFCLSNDERIRSYMTYNDWKEELYEANEQRWFVDRRKFNEEQIVKEDGPYVRLINSHEYDGSGDLIWHWTHTSQTPVDRSNRRQMQTERYMLITVPGIGEVANTVDPLRRATTDTSLVTSMHHIGDQPFQRYNLAKFPCPLKRLQTSYEKLIEICVISPDEDDDKWWSKLNACKWLKHVSKALHGAALLAKLLSSKNIELAGSDTDNNCLIASLVQILLRPKCRTIKGFCELIVREWIVRGHKFRERFGQVQYDVHGYAVQEAPIFLLFLDCVQQLILQNPFAFEFTDYLLLELYHSICYCYHHTFLFNNILERLTAISHCPANLLVLSAFDFSLYLHPTTYRLLLNDTSVFTQEKFPLAVSSREKSTAARIETTVISSDRPSRTVYYLETPKASTLKLDLPVVNEIHFSGSEQYDYDTIESPQIFASNFSVDWRTINLVLWSKCYSRYDQKHLPSPLEQQLAYDIACLKEDLENLATKSKRLITIDPYQHIGHANSWHPQALDTRV